MIKVNRLNQKEFVINSDLIYLIEETPDTVIFLSNGKKFVVNNSVDEVIDKIIDYKARINRFTIKLNNGEV